MKKNAFLLLLATSFLTLAGCGKGGNNNKPKDSLKDYEKANMTVDFADLESNVMVDAEIKNYVDAMEEQEKTLEKPYHFSSLYGPTDYERMAAKSDTTDSQKTYAAEDTGGVDSCQYLGNNKKDKNIPIVVKWDANGDTYEEGKIKFWSTEDFSDIREAAITVDANGVASASLENLFKATKYRAQVFNDGDVSQGFEFETADYPRFLNCGGVRNVRDIGGYMTSYGVRTNQGLLYRGYYISNVQNGQKGPNYSEEVDKVQREVMKIGVELDLQKASEIGGLDGGAASCLAGAEYANHTLISYENFLTQESYQNLPAIFKILANADQKHVYFHCWGGADRTGMLAVFINAICGVSYTDIIEDFEITSESNNKRCHMHNSSSAHYPKFINAFTKWSGYDAEKTMNENCYNWLVNVANVDVDDIEKVREIMIPGYADGKLEADTLIPNYTAKAEWKTDERSHWQEASEDSKVKCNWGLHKYENGVCACGKTEGGQQSGSSSQGGAVDYLQPLSRVWKEGTPANNSDGKQYIPLSEESSGKVGVKIKFADYSGDSTGTVSNGKIGPVNDDTAHLTYRLKAPKAGVYQLVMCGRVSDASYTLDKRKLRITLNGASVDIQGSERDGGLKADGDNDFVAAPSINLTGNEDVITITCCDNRIAFVSTSYLTFAEH